MRVHGSWVLAALGAALVACSGGGGGGPDDPVAAAPSPTLSTLALARGAANPGESVAASVTVRDGAGALLPGRSVVLAYSGAASIEPAGQVTDAGGLATFTLRATAATTGTVTATVDPGPGAVVLAAAPALAFEGPVVETCGALDPVASGTCEVTAGGPGLLLEGTVLTPGRVYEAGRVAIDASGLVTCVGCGCAPGGATVVRCPEGVISPGLVNASDYLSYDHNAPLPASVERYEHRSEWRRGLSGHTQLVFAGDTSATALTWSEVRQVMAGTTAIAGSRAGAGLLRNLDQAAARLGLDGAPLVIESFPLGDNSGPMLTSGCGYPGLPAPAEVEGAPAYLATVAEGVGAAAHNEAVCLGTGGGASGGVDVIGPHLVMVQGLALGPLDLALMGARGAKLVWTPRSNLRLYGATAPVTTAARLGVPIALGTYWTLTGSPNLLRELRCADRFNREQLAGFFDDEALWLMATADAAGVTATGEALGTLAVGRAADVAVYARSGRHLHRAILEAGPQDVVLVLRAGAPLYGDAAVVAALSPGCESLPEVCSVAKRVCLAETGYSFAELAAANGAHLGLFSCGEPAEEPTCTPARSASVEGSTVYDGLPATGDRDGDGLPDASDLCPSVFSPVLPVHAGQQPDVDDDGIGDACDPCPLDQGTTACLG